MLVYFTRTWDTVEYFWRLENGKNKFSNLTSFYLFSGIIFRTLSLCFWPKPCWLAIGFSNAADCFENVLSWIFRQYYKIKIVTFDVHWNKIADSSRYIMDPTEVEFLAENKNVSIVPNFNFDRIYLISGDVGPFRAGLPVQVPIWMATNLRQRQKCRIIAPDWMDTEKLEQVKEEESQSRYSELTHIWRFLATKL